MVAPSNKRFLLESDKGVANGLATLGADSKIPGAQLPARVDYGAATPWINILAKAQGLAGDYTGRNGVVGTGTDDRAAIQAMLNAASDPDGVYQWSELKERGVGVEIPAGVYIITAPSSGSSLEIPEGVDADFSKAMMFFDYPAAATGNWSAILLKNSASLTVPKFMTPSQRNTAPGAPGTSNTDRLYDGIRVLGANNLEDVVRAKGAAQIKGFKGASIRGIGSWVAQYNGPIMLNSDFGYVASNWPSSNVYGYAHTAALPGVISGVRLHTDVYFRGPYFNGNPQGGYLGVVTGDPSTPHALDYSRAGGHQAYFNGTIFEHFANYAVNVTGGLFSFTDCAFEECGKDNFGMASFDSVQSVVIKNHRINYTGMSVPGPSGTSISPFVPSVFNIGSVQSFTWEAGYYHNTYSNAKFADNNATVFDVLAPRVDALAFTTASSMYTPLGRAVSSGYTKAAKIGASSYIWEDTAGDLRQKSPAPTSDKDGRVMGPRGSFGLPMLPGKYYTTTQTAVSTLAMTEASERALPFIVGRSCTLDRLAVEVTTAGAAGAVIRLGIRADDGAGRPGAVLAEGTVDATTTGVKELTISLAVKSGDVLWTSATAQGGAATTPTVRSAPAQNGLIPDGSTWSTLTFVAGGANATGVTGALPASPSWSLTSSAVRAGVRAA